MNTGETMTGKIACPTSNLEAPPGMPRVDQPMVTAADAAAMLEVARQVITQIGLDMPERDLREAVLAVRGTARGRRIVFTPEEVEEYLRACRNGSGSLLPGGEPEPRWYRRDTVLGLSVMPYSHTWLDPATDRHVPLTAARVEAGARLLGSFHGQIEATVPGHPVDVPAALQPVFEYKAGAQYNPAGGGYGWLGAPKTAEYVLRMAEVMGRPITATVVYVTSPLRLGGAELRTALAHRGRLQRVHVGNMGSCGAGLPLMPKAALALSWAETIAGAMCVEALTGLPANWGAGLEPFDLRAQTIPFGAPEQVLLYRFSWEASWRLRGAGPRGFHVPLLTMAKRPGAQAAMEKALAAAFGVSLGTVSLGAAGSLSADEVFSPAQLLLDLELRDWLSRAAQGVAYPQDDLGRAFEMIREGLSAGSFAAADTTLDHYREASWFPRHLRREMLNRWRELGSPEAVQTAGREALARLEAATWVLPEPQFSRLEDVYEEARREVG